MDKFYQACFSRLGSNNRNAGWQLTNTSPDIPHRMLDIFETRQKNNEPVNRATPVDAQNRPLCAMEINCDSDFVSFTRIQYGVPCYGREGMFCHGYFMANAYELLKDPNRLLTISNDNFCFRPDDVLSAGMEFSGAASDSTDSAILEQYLARTQQIPSELKYDAPFDEENALQICGMNKERYVLFIHCLFAAWSKNAKTTIYVQTDGSDRMTRAMLYLAYSAVPYSLRPKLVASTFADARNATLVFTNEQLGSCLYFNPATGETNVLNSAQRKRWKNTPLATFYAANYESMASEKDSYFGAIEAELKQLGDIYAQDMSMLELAHKLAFGSEDESDLIGNLYDWLNLPLNYNDYLESRLADLLGRVIAEKCELGPDLDQMLNQRLSDAVSQKLITQGYNYQSLKLSRMSVKDGCAYLQTLDAGSALFKALRADLSTRPTGQEMLCEYYLAQANALKEDKKCTYQMLADFMPTFADLSAVDPVWKVLLEKGRDIAYGKLLVFLSDHTRASAAASSGTFWFKALVAEYEAFMNGPLTQNSKRSAKQYTQNVVTAMKKKYDQYFRNDFKAERYDEYVTFYGKYGREPGMQYSNTLLKMYERAQKLRFKNISDFVAGGCAVGNERPADEKERLTIVRSLMAYCEKYGVAEKCLEFTFWFAMADALRQNAVSFMIQKKAKLFCDPNSLKASLQVDRTFWSDDKVEEVRKLYQQYLDQHEDNPYKKSKEVLDAEAKYRADERKRAEKDAKQKSREQERLRQQQEKERQKQDAQKRKEKQKNTRRQKPDASGGGPIYDGFVDDFGYPAQSDMPNQSGGRNVPYDQDADSGFGGRSYADSNWGNWAASNHSQGYGNNPGYGSNGGYNQGYDPNGGYNPGYGNNGGYNQGYDPNGGYNQGYGNNGGYNQGYDPNGGYNQGYGNNGGYNQGYDPNGGYNPGYGNNGGYNQGYDPNGGYNQGYGSNGGYNQGYDPNGGYNQGYGNNGGYNQGYDPNGGYNQGYGNNGGYNQGYDPNGGYNQGNQQFNSNDYTLPPTNGPAKTTRKNGKTTQPVIEDAWTHGSDSDVNMDDDQTTPADSNPKEKKKRWFGLGKLFGK